MLFVLRCLLSNVNIPPFIGNVSSNVRLLLRFTGQLVKGLTKLVKGLTKLVKGLTKLVKGLTKLGGGAMYALLKQTVNIFKKINDNKVIVLTSGDLKHILL